MPGMKAAARADIPTAGKISARSVPASFRRSRIAANAKQVWCPGVPPQRTRSDVGATRVICSALPDDRARTRRGTGRCSSGFTTGAESVWQRRTPESGSGGSDRRAANPHRARETAAAALRARSGYRIGRRSRAQIGLEEHLRVSVAGRARLPAVPTLRYFRSQDTEISELPMAAPHGFLLNQWRVLRIAEDAECTIKAIERSCAAIGLVRPWCAPVESRLS
jgi:hypothetical protein